MDGKDIINKIIEEDGHCGLWATKSVCEACPMSKLVKKKDGSYLSCIEALGATEMTEEQADARYKEVATKILLDQTIDDILKGEDGT